MIAKRCSLRNPATLSAPVRIVSLNGRTSVPCRNSFV